MNGELFEVDLISVEVSGFPTIEFSVFGGAEAVEVQLFHGGEGGFIHGKSAHHLEFITRFQCI